MTKLTHFNSQGRAKMVDISEKNDTIRTAVAKSSIFVSEDIYHEIIGGTNKKGEVLSVAQVSGIMAAKQTSNLIPMCHPISLTSVNITFQWKIVEDQYELCIEGEVKTKGSTGVEMEALTAVSVTALTIYDMCKAVDKNMVIGPTMLMNKTGGKSGTYERD
ncbi:cyclic pyranopterin monophosphate synthase accessory protein [Lysinibacillus sp. PLM2]|nr:cyclic pyranopterin monophosphate synthase accessory protein [Lysinibacillus sp. PLM2]